MPAPAYESTRYAFYFCRVGSTLVRKSDNRSVYFQPGDCDAKARENVEHCFEHTEAWPGENDRVFNHWAAEYF